MASMEGARRQPQQRGKPAPTSAVSAAPSAAPSAAGSGGSGASAGGQTSAPVATASASASSTTESKWKGRVVKRFKLIDELGEGAMGRVFIAEDTVLKRHVALKLLPARFRDGRPNHRTERLIRVARSVASLEHPNTLSIFEIDQSGGVHYIAMELAEGGDLEKLVQLSGPMEIERACQLGAEAAEALSHAHARGIVHRDVKPANLLLTRSGRCKVCDFGLALFDDNPDAEGRMRCVGTPNFIAPEIAQGKGATASSDIYSLGCTLFFLLTGRAPFSGPNSRDVMKQHINSPLPDLRKWRQDVPEKLAAAIEKACAKDPAQRWDSAARLAKVLRTFTIPTALSASASGMSPLDGAGSAHGSGGGSHGPGGSHGYEQFGGGGGTLPPISAAQLAAILPPPPSASDKSRLAFGGPVVWAGVGTVAAAILIALGVLLSRSSPSSTNAAPTANNGTPAAPTAKPQAPAEVASATPSSPVAPVVPPAPQPSAFANSPANLVSNGDLETVDGKGNITGWGISERSRPSVQTPEESGNRFVRLINDDPSKNVMIDQKLELNPSWKSLKISARMRAQNLKPGSSSYQDARVSAAFQNVHETKIGTWLSGPSLRTDSTSWVQRSVKLDIPPDATTLYLELAMLNTTGQADFDDIVVTPVVGARSAGTSSPTAGLVAGAELINNGAMEAPAGAEGVPGWMIPDRCKPQVQVLSENGKHFLRMTNDSAAREVVVDQRIPVEPGWKAIAISARMRASNFKLGKALNNDARVSVTFRDANDKKITPRGPAPSPPRVDADTPWVPYTTTLEVPSGAKAILVQLAMFNSTGTVDFQDISVVPQSAK